MATTRDKYGGIINVSYKPTGINNCMDPSKLPEGYSPYLINVDADDLGGVTTRPLDPYYGVPAVGLACFWHGRNWSAVDNEVFFDAGIKGKATREYGGKLQTFNSKVTMLVELVNVMYIGTQDYVYAITGGDPMLGNLEMRQAHQYGAVEGSCVKVENENIGVQREGYSVIFTSHNGINIGDNIGNITNMTTNIVAIPKCLTAEAWLRTINNMTHYVVKLGAATSSATTQFNPIVPDDLL